MGTKDIRLLVDTREPKKIFRLLELEGIPHTRYKLDVGDIHYKHVTIERKTLNDFLQSIKGTDGTGYKRIYSQMIRMSQLPIPILMISGTLDALQKNIEDHLHKKVNVKVVFGMAASIYVRFSIPTIWVMNDRELVQIAYRICKKVEEGKWQKGYHTQRKRIRHKDRRVEILRNVYRISENQAKALLRLFGGVKQTFKAKYKRIQLADGIGEVTAKKIWEVNKLMRLNDN